MTRTSTEQPQPEAAASTAATLTTVPLTTTDPEPLRTYATRLHLLRTIGLRVLGSLIVLWGAATTAFLAQVAQPGDRATTILNLRSGQIQERTAQETAPINAEYGFDQSIPAQYLHYLGGLLRGDLGTSYQQHRPVWDVIGEQLAPTAALSLLAIAAAWVLMIVWLTLTAGRAPWLRGVGAAAEVAAASLPHYWLGAILLLSLAMQLGLFPVVGGGAAGLVLPVLTLAIPLAGFLGQAARTDFEHALTRPFILSARTRGLSDTSVRLRHALKHSLRSPLQLTGWAMGATVSGAVVVEAVFGRTGISRVLVTAIESQDLPVVTGIVILIALVYVLAGLLIDALSLTLDPRRNS
jgi:peptide/nickel transport system permease protein